MSLTQKLDIKSNKSMSSSTMTTHYLGLLGMEKRNTEAKMVKNFQVVMMTEQVRGPKYTTAMTVVCEKH